MNKVMLIGNVGKEPDVRYYDRDQAVATFSLATTERGYTLQNGTQVPDRTEWHNVVLYRGLAKIAEKYVHKGDKLFIEGKIRNRSYDDQKGVKRYVTEIIADNMEMLSPKSAIVEQASVSQAPVGSTASQNTNDSETEDDQLPF
ncbi:single-stranded DNA-binding protein [Prevotella sp.]|uniref:single-stranded DNA-binding protein n=1 Tax=uncultured Prevotella sp. TaxID=159272 RepID=UPI002629C7A9|nr:single-stranded DNA-binding protein [uncultured Prevotella sp.]